MMTIIMVMVMELQIPTWTAILGLAQVWDDESNIDDDDDDGDMALLLLTHVLRCLDNNVVDDLPATLDAQDAPHVDLVGRWTSSCKSQSAKT